MSNEKYNSQFNIAKKVRNIVTIDRANNLVLKEYISGSYDEKNTRLKQEISALSEIPKFFSFFNVPFVVDAEFGEQPFIKMQLVSSKGNLKELIPRSSFPMYSNVLLRLSKDIKEFHNQTLLIQARPTDILSKAEKYGVRYLEIIDKNKFDILIKNLEDYEKVNWSKIHQDVKLSNILYIDEQNYSLIDWEHYSFGSQQYEFATLLLSIILLLKNKFDKMNLTKLISHLEPPKSEETIFYLALATRSLIELGPATERNEYGNSEQVKAFLLSVFNTCVEQVTLKHNFSKFIFILLNSKL